MEESLQEDRPDRFSQNTLRFFLRHVSGSAKRQKEREEKISGFESQITMLKDTALSKKPNKKEIGQGFDDLSGRIKELISEEKVIVLNQEKEERIIEEMKERLDLLEEKFNGLSHVHSMTFHDHSKRIDEIGKKMRVIAGSAFKYEKERVKHNPHLVISTMKHLGNKKKQETIKKLTAMIQEAEKGHKALKGKKVPKQSLDSLKRTIMIYKRKLKNMKEW